MKWWRTSLVLAALLAASACADQSAPRGDAVADADASGRKRAEPPSRSKQRSEAEDLVDAYARDTVDSINAGQRAISGGAAQSFYLDTKEIREYGLQPNGRYNYVAVLRYCEVTRCQVSSRSTELVLVVPRKRGGLRVAQSLKLGVNGRISLNNEGVLEATSVEYGPDDPPCCPSAQLVRKYRLEGEALRQL